MTFVFSGLIFWDMPFGLGVADWDTLLTDPQLEMLFNQLKIINTSRSTVLALVVHFRDIGRVAKAMEENGYRDVHPFYVYKPQQNRRGTNCFIFAVECILVGYMAATSERKLNFEQANPLFRHNLLFSHNVRARAQLPGTGEEVNTTQKHPAVAHHLASIFCEPGSNALVLGAGSGSDVIGAMWAGVNVVGVEKDITQFEGCRARLVELKSNFAQERKKIALERQQMQHLQEQASRFSAWDPEEEKMEKSAVASADAEGKAADKGKAGRLAKSAARSSSSSSSSSSARPSAPSSSSSSSSDPPCVACGQTISADRAVCSSAECSRMVHAECLLYGATDKDGGFCSTRCLGAGA